MRAQIIAHLKAGGAGLDPAARAAIASLAEVHLEKKGQEGRRHTKRPNKKDEQKRRKQKKTGRIDN